MYNDGNSERMFVKQPWLEELGLENPDTLDDFVNVLHAFKAAYPDSYPLGGGALGDDPRSYVLNAFGFLVSNENDAGYGMALREGEAVIPGGTAVYRDYLDLMRGLYEDGILSPSFFTTDATTANALVAENKAGYFPSYPYKAVPEIEKFQQWTSAKPLTSQWNSTKQWLYPTRVNIGGIAVSSATDHAETICRFLDFFFSEVGGLYTWNGPMNGNADCLDMTQGWIINENGDFIYPDVQEGKYSSNLERNYNTTMGFHSSFGNRAGSAAHPEWNQTNVMQWLYGAEVVKPAWDMTNGDRHFRSSMEVEISPYEVTGYPAIVYFDEKTTIRMSDLSSVINAYIETETAKFITGIRDLGEFDKYLEELNSLGFEEYLVYYKGAYADYLKAMN